MKMLDKNGIPIDLTSGNHVRIRRSWRTPMAGRSGVISIEPNDPYGKYVVQFEGGLRLRYGSQDLELMVASYTFPERVLRAFLRFARSLHV